MVKTKMETKMLSFFIISYILLINGAPIPINLQDNKTGDVQFDLQLPDNKTVQIELSFRLLFSNEQNTSYKPQTTEADDVTKDSYISTTTLKSEYNHNKFVTLDEAIEGFRQDLISKEKEIGGIIESDAKFYRHFKLEFDDDKFLKIRCTYDSNYTLHSLKISCFEFHEFETERILSNGEIEYTKQYDLNYKSDIEFVDLRKMKQTYSMDISK